MKKILQTLLLFSSLNSFAQVSVNLHPSIGSTFAINGLNYEEIIFSKSIRPTGGNLNWDFSGITPNTYQDTIRYVDPNSLNSGKLAIGANLAILDNTNFLTSLGYYSISNSEQNLLGFSDDDTVYTKLDNPYLTGIFPLNFDNSYEDQAIFNVDSDFGNIKAELESYSKVDGWGEVKTKLGTYPCLRIKSTSTIQGSLVGVPFFNSTNDDYRWISPGITYDLFRYTVNETDFNNQLSNDTSSIYLVNQKLTKITDVSKNILNFEIGSNPVKDLLTLKIDEDLVNEVLQISIYDINSEIVYQDNAFLSNKKISVSNWPRGIYMINLSNGKKSWGLKKLILQ